MIMIIVKNDVIDVLKKSGFICPSRATSRGCPERADKPHDFQHSETMKVLTGGLYLTLGNSWGSCNATATQFGRYSPRQLCDRQILPSPSPSPSPSP